MEELITILQNADGGYDLGSLITLFGFMIAIDGIVIIIHAVISGFRGK